MSIQLGQGSPVVTEEPVGPDGQVVAEPVDVDGLEAVFLLPDGHLCAGVEPAVGAGVLPPGLGSGGFLEVGYGACTST